MAESIVGLLKLLLDDTYRLESQLRKFEVVDAYDRLLHMRERIKNLIKEAGNG